MKTLSFFLLLFSSLSLLAQEEAFSPYYQLEEGKTYYLSADNVNLRDKADIKSNSLGKMTLGTAVKLEKITETPYESKGFRTPWCQVNFNGKKGYIPAAFLSLGELRASDDKNTLFLFGISEIIKRKNGEYEYDSVRMQVRVCKNNKEIQKIEYFGRGSIQTTRDGEIFDDKGVAGIKNIVYINYSDNYCGGASGSHVFFWDGKKLWLVKNLMSGSDVPYFASEDFIFPKDKGGKAGLILMKSESGNHEEDDKITYDERSMEEFVWKNNKLESVKKYDIK